MRDLQCCIAKMRRLSDAAPRYISCLWMSAASPVLVATLAHVSGRTALTWDHVIARVAPVVAIAVAVFATVITFAGYMP